MAGSVEAHLARAFALAFFFHPDRDDAIGIAERAARKLRIAERTQVRRVYYRPSGRRLRNGMASLRFRTKVSVERAQLLQRLVLHESEVLEREMESRTGIATLTDDEIALRFVEYLVHCGWRRNSFHVTVAIGRILYGYETAAVLDLFAAVVQDPDRVPEDSYLRQVKRRLLREIDERFGSLLRTQVGARGEESLEGAPPTPEQRRLVTRCLELLTPWDTTCQVPAGFDGMKHTLGQLRFTGADPDDEHAIEVSRMHSLIHPDCFSNLASGLRLELPADRLRIPRPVRSSDTGGGAGPAPDRFAPPELEPADLDRLRGSSSFERSAERSSLDDRARDPIARVVVSVDGRERITLDVQTGARASCELGDTAEVVEVEGSGPLGQRLLAIHVLRFEPLEPALATRREDLLVPLGRGRELLVAITSTPSATLGRRFELAATCRETSILSRLGAPRLWGKSAGARRPWMRPAVALTSVFSALALALLVARWDGSQQTATPPRPGIHADGETTRGAAPPVRGTTLQTARVLYLDAAALAAPDLDAGRAGEVIGLLRTELLASGRFTTTTDREAADAALKVRLNLEGPPAGADQPAFRLELELVDERGEVLWSAVESGAPWQAAAKTAIGDLVEAIR